MKTKLLFALGSVFIFTASLPADTVTFAQFQETSAGGNNFAFVNKGSSAIFESKDAATGAASIPVLFSLIGFTTSQLPADLQGPQAAHMTFSITTTQKVTTTGNLFDQNLYATSSSGAIEYGTISFTRNTPDSEIKQTNLLTVSFYSVAGGLDGIRRGQTATLSADNDIDNNGQFDYVSFSSSYLKFNATDENLALSFTSASPCFTARAIARAGSRGCVVSGAMLNFLHSFTAAGTGTFASDPMPATIFATPEPSSATLLLFGVFILCGLIRRRKATVLPVKPSR